MQNDIATGTLPIAATFMYSGGTIAVTVGKITDDWAVMEAEEFLESTERKAREVVYGPIWG